MPIVKVELCPGRTYEQKARFVKEVTELASKVLKCPVGSIDVMFIEVDGSNWARGGQFLDPWKHSFDGTNGLCP